MADARRIVFSAMVLPKETTTDEEGGTKTSILRQDSSGDTVSSRYGSKGNTDLTAAQWGEGWVSMYQSASQGGTWNNIDSVWQNVNKPWTGALTISSSGVRIGPNDSTVVKFLYIKNLGDYAAQVSLNGGSNYDIIIPAGGSISFRGTSNLTMQNVFVQRVSSDTEIEYVIAK